MADKLDFMTELAKDIDARKHGETSSFGTINDFVPRQREIKDTEYDREQDYENTRPVSVPPAQTASIPVSQPEQYYEEPVQQEAPQPEQYYEEPVQQAEPQPEPVFTKPTTQEEMYGSGQNGPASFHEEERVKVEKEPFRPSPVMIGGAVFGLLLIGFLVWFLFLRAKITIPDFTGKTLTEATNWAKQNKIDASALARNYEYSVEYDSDVIISQTPAGGSHIKQSTPITFTVSQGADPNEPIDFPDIKSMTYSDLNDWKNENKLSKTKISTEYNTTVPKDEVISFELKNVSESEFTRGSTLTIKVSKGPAPAGQVTVENFVGKSFADASTWANNKKVKIVRQEINSDTVESGFIISQLPASGAAMNEGENFTVTVSKGKGVKIPNLVGYSKEQLEAWSSSKNNNVTIVKKSIYNEAPLGSVIAQGVAPGTIVDAGDVLELTISLYMPILETNSRAWLGKDYLELRAWCDDVNYNGADIQAGSWGDWQYPTCSDTYPTPGQVVNYACYYGTSDLADGCGRPLNNYSRINYQISSGPCPVTPSTPEPPVITDVLFTSNDIKNLQAISSFCKSSGLSCKFNNPVDSGPNVKVELSSGGTYTSDDTTPFSMMIKSDTTLTITYNKNADPSTSPASTTQTENTTTDAGTNNNG